MKTLLSRSVSMVLALCMIVTMFACAFTVASADSTRLDNWQGNITAVVEADYTAASGSYMKWSETDLYVCDSVKTITGTVTVHGSSTLSSTTVKLTVAATMTLRLLMLPGHGPVLLK